MISNKEKRLSQAYDVYANQLEGSNHHHDGSMHATNHVASYGMINNNNNLPNSINSGSNGSSGKDHLLGKKHLNDRNSHSLSHDFSQLYITNLKSHMVNNHSHTQGKKYDRHDVPVLPSLEEINSYKRDAAEAKKQMMQMEKSITYWSDCTEYWRTKWRKTRDEKNQARIEIKQLKSKLTRLEHQLQVSDDKRTRLGDEVNMLHSELSRYMYRFDTDVDGPHRAAKQPHSAVHYNSDRRVDYRKQRRKKETLPNSSKRNELSSTEEEEFQRFDLRSSELPLSKMHSAVLRPSDYHVSSSSKVVLRNHERLLDKKIVNRKRFSQVVMCDEDEIFQFNQEIPSNSLSKNSDNNTLKYSETSNNNDSATENNSYQQRFMEHVSEEEEEEEEGCSGEEEEEDSSDQFRRRKLLVEDSTNEFDSNKAMLNHSNLSTIATNSECANVGSIRADDIDEDSFRSDNNIIVNNLDHPHHHQHIKVPVSSMAEVDADREGIGVDEEEEDDEV